MNSKLRMIQKPSPWYEEGLPFKCTGCGKCCSGAPGYVWINEKEMDALANFLKVTLDELKSKYLIRVKNKYSIKDLKHANYNCIFLRDNKCTVYPVRPSQCRTYPFWPSIMRSKQTWDQEASLCEGIREEYPSVNADEIENKMKQ